jgi:hypothetical protein
VGVTTYAIKLNAFLALAHWNFARPPGFPWQTIAKVHYGRNRMADSFDRLKDAHLGREEDQPLILAVLIVFIALTLLFFL